VAAADGGDAAAEAQRALPQCAAAAYAAGRLAATGAARPAAFVRRRRAREAPYPPPLQANVLMRCVGGGTAAADGRRSDGWPSASEVAGAPVAHGVGSTACADGGGGRTPQNIPHARFSAAQCTVSSAVWPSASSPRVSTDGGVEPVSVLGGKAECTVLWGMRHF